MNSAKFAHIVCILSILFSSKPNIYGNKKNNMDQTLTMTPLIGNSFKKDSKSVESSEKILPDVNQDKDFDANKTQTADMFTFKNDSSIIYGELKNGFKYAIKQCQNPKDQVFMTLNVNTGSAMDEDDQQLYVEYRLYLLSYTDKENWWKKNPLPMPEWEIIYRHEEDEESK